MSFFRPYVKTFLKFLLYLILSLFLALLLRLFLCNFYRVPSDSMAPTVTAGDFILAGKLKYGARIFTSLKFSRYSDPPMKRVPGLGRIRRNDVLVFNFPYGKTWDTVRMNPNKYFIKRCVGIPGDSLSIVNGFYRIAGLSDTAGFIPAQKQLARYGNNLDSAVLRTFPFDTIFRWDAFNFGPFYIPAAGTTIPLTPKNYILFHRQMVYETNASVILKDSSVYINDTLAHGYTFRHDWFFMAGDNAVNAQDSRHIGLIPDDYIVGIASRIMSSKDMYTGKRRWKRTMKRIK